MRTLQIDKRVFTLPASWSEMDADQILAVGELAEKGLSNYEFRIALLRMLTGITVLQKKEIVIDEETYYYFRHGITTQSLISETDIAFIASAFDFMFRKKTTETDETVYLLQYKEIRNLVPEIKTDIGKLYGPADALSNLKTSEYIHAETARYNFLKTGKYHFAVRLFAILYRPEAPGVDITSPDYTGDRREAFNDFLLGERTAALMNTPKGCISIVVMWYEACRDFMEVKWPEVFENVEGTAEKTDPFTGFMRLVNSMANNDVTKSDQVRQTYIYDTMFALQAILIQDRKMKDALKTPKR